MLKWLKWPIRLRLNSFQRRYDYDVSYMTEMLDTSFRGFMRFARVADMAEHREAVPLPAWFAARLVSTLAEDCGPCTQLAVKMADEAGVSPDIVRAIIENDQARMGDEAQLGWRFAQAVLAHDTEADVLREQIAARWGAKAVVSLALVIAASRMFPTVKYAMGHGRSCQRLRVGGADLVPAARPLPVHKPARESYAQ